MNPYLAAQRKKYDELRASIEGLQTRAAEEGRDLTDDELRSVKEQGEQAKGLAAQIEDLTEIETRNQKVAGLAAQVNGGGDGQTQTRGQALGVQAQERDPGHYRSEKDGGRHSFFADIYRSRMGDEDASQRLVEHQRAYHQRAGLTTTGQGVGVVAPHWMTEEFETLARQGRALANVVRSIPLGDDPRPITLPKQIAGTDAVVAEQVNENDPVNGADAWDSDVDTVTPKPTSGKQIVARQLLDMSSPAADVLIYGDLMEVYNDKVEAKVGLAVVTAATAVTSAVFANEAAFKVAGAASDAIVDLAIAVRNARKRPADILTMSVTRYGEFLKLKDSTGRPLMPLETAGPMNVIGVGSVAVDGRLEGLGIVATDGIGSGAKPDKFVAMRAMDTILLETNTLRFRYEEQAGPESIVLGIWGYTAVKVRQGGKSVRRGEVTA